MTKEYDPRPAATRLAAVQAAYEIDMMDAHVDDVVTEFAGNRWKAADDQVTDEIAAPKPELLKQLIRGVAGRRADIDASLSPEKIQNRKIEELEAILRAILRTATYELLDRDNVPARTIISAYAAICDAFFDEGGPQAKLVSGILNSVARDLRKSEFMSDTKAGMPG